MFLCTITSERGRRHKLWRQTPAALKSAAPAPPASLRARRASLVGLGDQCYVSCCHFASCIVPEEGTIMCSLEAGCSQGLSGEITSRRETPMVQLCQQPPPEMDLCVSQWEKLGKLPFHHPFSPVPPVLILVLILKKVERGTGRSSIILSCCRTPMLSLLSARRLLCSGLLSVVISEHSIVSLQDIFPLKL